MEMRWFLMIALGVLFVSCFLVVVNQVDTTTLKLYYAEQLTKQPEGWNMTQQQQKAQQQQPDRDDRKGSTTDARAAAARESDNRKGDSPPLNFHSGFPLACTSEGVNASAVHPWTGALVDMVHERKGKNGESGYWTGHRMIPRDNNCALLTKLQACLYTNLEYWWTLARELNITRWAAHGGTAMNAYCHRSIAPWDDDIDITIGSCEPLHRLYEDVAHNVSDVYPNLTLGHYAQKKTFVGKLLPGNDWILIKGSFWSPKRLNNWYKLKSLKQTSVVPSKDLSGIDIMCFEEGVSAAEYSVMNMSGYANYLHGDLPLKIVEFGPSYMQLLPDKILKEYVLQRYEKHAFCDFPFDKTNNDHAPKLGPRASQIEVALSNWYTSDVQRETWLQQAGQADGNGLNKNVPNLNELEIDNSIADPAGCLIDRDRPIRAINFNAERGTYWAELAQKVKTMKDLEDPDVILLNEMDIGMARSGNLHTARMLAFELGMNYAWGLEFIELTRGTEKEQNATEGMENSLGLHGNAILSKCKLYDPLVIRDKLDPIYFSNKTSWMNANGFEKRLGGRVGMFVRVGPTIDIDGEDRGRHMIAGSVHKVGRNHRERVFRYFGIGNPPAAVPAVVEFSHLPKDDNGTYRSIDFNTGPSELVGIIVGGDFGMEFCPQYGLHNPDLLHAAGRKKTFSSDCSKPTTGNRRGDFFCSNMAPYAEDKVLLPCFAAENGTTIQMSDHAIMEISLKGNKQNNVSSA